MDKQLLANELRARQRKLGQVPAHMIRALSDDQIIDAYITCSCCGEKQAEGSDLDYAITTARNPDHFLDIAQQFGQIKHAINQTEPTTAKDEDGADEEDEVEEPPVYQEKDIRLFAPSLIWTVCDIEGADDVYEHMDAILGTSWDALLTQTVDAPMKNEHRLQLSAEQAQRFKDFQAGRFWLEEVTASIEVQIGEALPVSIESLAVPMVIASDASQNVHRDCEQSAIANLIQVLARMGLNGGRISREVKFERFRQTPTSDLKPITHVPGKGDRPQKRPTETRIRKGRR
jgi:hypothetical protein